MNSILIVYATAGGNTEVVCEKIQAFFQEKNIQSTLLRCEFVKSDTIAQAQTLIFACPTYGHGELEKNFERFLFSLRDIDLKNKKLGIIALGDPKYDQDYCLESANILLHFVQKHGGNLVNPPLKIVKSPFSFFPFISKWAEEFVSKM